MIGAGAPAASSSTTLGSDLGSDPASRTLIHRWGRRALLAMLASTGAFFLGPLLGMSLPWTALALLGAGALAVEALPAWAPLIAAVIGLALITRLNPVYGAYHLVMVVTLFACRRHPWPFAAAAILLALVIPKFLFRHFYHRPGFYNWFNEASLALVLFVSATWWRDLRDGRLPPGATQAPLGTWATLYLFPTHAANPLVFSPGDLAKHGPVDGRGVLTSLSLFGLKALAHTALWTLLPGRPYAAMPGPQLLALSRADLWLVVAANYLDLVLVLSGTADLAIMWARLYGWSLPLPFRWALLAWNPVELWRRWGIYNRRFLLKNVYFPLGGNRRHPYLNVMLTFLGSAWVLHSGWFGSKYLTVGPGGWRDEALYFLLQGTAVCACLLTWRWRGKATKEDARLAWRWSRLPATIGTQAMSALVHVVILAQSVTLTDRWRLMGRCLGG